MRRLVYSPRVDAYVKTDDGSFDVSPYIVRGSVNRKLDSVSAASITIRNPKMMFTEHQYRDVISGAKKVGPLFHPMDPIVITLTRLRDRPIQVFTGFLDTTPYLQLFPGTITLVASCTLKKLQYTYFDPGLPFFRQFLSDHGWESAEQLGQIMNLDASGDHLKPKEELDDASIGKLLYDILTGVGHWDDKDIFIEKLPKDLVELVAKVFDVNKKESEQGGKELRDLIHNIIGSTSLGSASTDQHEPDSSGDASLVPPGPEFLKALRACESGGNYQSDTGNGFYGAYQFDQGTWESVGGHGSPSDASPEEQDKLAAKLFQERGLAPWPNCGPQAESEVGIEH